MTGTEARAYLNRYDVACFTARVTGRVVFGQLWMSDPTTDLILKAHYADYVADAINSATPLSSFFGGCKT